MESNRIQVAGSTNAKERAVDSVLNYFSADRDRLIHVLQRATALQERLVGPLPDRDPAGPPTGERCGSIGRLHDTQEVFAALIDRLSITFDQIESVI